MGCLALYLFYRLAQDFSEKSIPVSLVVFLFAFSTVYIRYASEVKQYSTDMAVSTFLIWAALNKPVSDRKSFLLWMLIGSIAIWMSMPAVFILAGIGLYFLYQHIEEKGFQQLGNLILLGGIWLAQFGVYYYLILGDDLQKSGLTSYHQTHFWPLWPNEAVEWERLSNLSHSLLNTLIGHTVWAQLVGIICLIAGVYFLWKKKKGTLLLLAVPPVLCLLASGLGLYSLMERLSLFMMPSLGLILLSGVDGFWKKATAWGQVGIVLAFLAILPIRKGWMYFGRPLQYEEMRPLLLALNDQIKTGEQIWVDHNAEAAFRWYTFYDKQNLSWEQNSTIIYNAWDKLASQELLLSPDTSSTYWLIFSHLVSDFNRMEMKEDLAAMDKTLGPPVQELRFPGVAAWQYVGRKTKEIKR